MARAHLEKHLPPHILARASLRGNEYAWPPDDIPAVITAARDSGLVNVGGQLQFRLPDGTCECYWVQVDTYQAVPSDLPWRDRVVRTAENALTEFALLKSKYDFLEEGMRSFASHLNALKEKGIEPAATMCFVWYVHDLESESEATRGHTPVTLH